MTGSLRGNDGSRPSRLALARYATGEGTDEERARIAAWLDANPDGRAYLDALEAARAEVAPLDVAALRRRAAQVPTSTPVVPSPANRPFALRWVVPLLVAALALFVIAPWDTAPPPDGPDIRVKGDATLALYTLRDERLSPWDGAPLGEGAVLGFRVRADRAGPLTLASIDGTGAVTLLHPVEGEASLDVSPGVEVALPFTVVLDDAPGPETFVATIGESAPALVDALGAAWRDGGSDGVLAWAAQAGAIAVPVAKP